MTVYELMAIFGWTSAATAEVYTREADRKRLARQAANKLLPGENESGKSIPSPSQEVRAAERKA